MNMITLSDTVLVEFACALHSAPELEAQLAALDTDLSDLMFTDTYGGYVIYSVIMTREYAVYVRLSNGYLSERMRAF